MTAKHSITPPKFVKKFSLNFSSKPHHANFFKIPETLFPSQNNFQIILFFFKKNFLNFNQNRYRIFKTTQILSKIIFPFNFSFLTLQNANCKTPNAFPTNPISKTICVFELFILKHRDHAY